MWFSKNFPFLFNCNKINQKQQPHDKQKFVVGAIINSDLNAAQLLLIDTKSESPKILQGKVYLAHLTKFFMLMNFVLVYSTKYIF